MRIVRGTKVKWKDGKSYIKGRVKAIYKKATRTLNDQMEQAFLIRQENGMLVIKKAGEVEKV